MCQSRTNQSLAAVLFKLSMFQLQSSGDFSVKTINEFYSLTCNACNPASTTVGQLYDSQRISDLFLLNKKNILQKTIFETQFFWCKHTICCQYLGFICMFTFVFKACSKLRGRKTLVLFKVKPKIMKEKIDL